MKGMKVITRTQKVTADREKMEQVGIAVAEWFRLSSCLVKLL